MKFLVVTAIILFLGLFVWFFKRKPSRNPIEMGILGVMHTNINCSNFERSKAFYEMLGFKQVMTVREEGEEDIAAAVGMPPYNVRGGIFTLKDGSLIDLLEWKSPSSSEPPYSHLYHLGLARLAFETKDIDADVARLTAQGVEFLSEPVTVPGSFGMKSKFVCFKDPDGTVLELIQTGKLMSNFRKLIKAAGRAAHKDQKGKVVD